MRVIFNITQQSRDRWLVMWKV